MIVPAVRLFLSLEALAFLAAALTHFGVLMGGYEHFKAGTAEAVIGAALVVALVLTRLQPESTGGIGFAAQLFALVGTLVGAVTIAIGVGPRTVPDLIYHAALLAVLAGGLLVMQRLRRE